MSSTEGAEAARLSRLDELARALIRSTRVGALGTLTAEGSPFVSMVPLLPLPTELGGKRIAPSWLIHVSALAAHARQMVAEPRISLLLMAADHAEAEPLALQRLTLNGQAIPLATESSAAQQARELYLRAFAQAELTVALPDFRFVRLEMHEARHVAGFGAARTLDADRLATLLG